MCEFDVIYRSMSSSARQAKHTRSRLDQYAADEHVDDGTVTHQRQLGFGATGDSTTTAWVGGCSGMDEVYRC